MSRSVFRKPSVKKSLSAKYKGTYKRKLKKAFIPGYGTKAAGWLHPGKKLYNKVYYRSSIDTRKLFTSNHQKVKTRSNSTAKQNKSVKGLTLNFSSEKLGIHPLAANILLYSIRIYQALYYLRNAGIVIFICAFIVPLVSWLVSAAIWSVIIAIAGRLLLKQFIGIFDTYLS